MRSPPSSDAPSTNEPSLDNLRWAAGRNVSRETFERLRALDGLVRHWQARINLVADSTLPELWRRHVLDSAQLPALAEDAGVGAGPWFDLGSGGGFPGLVVAALALDPAFPRRRVTLVESAGKKGAFLRRAALELGLEAVVISARIEAMTPDGEGGVVSARALAPLPALLALAEPWLARGALGVFPKGREAASEMAALGSSFDGKLEARPNRVAPEGSILLVSRRSAAEG